MYFILKKYQLIVFYPKLEYFLLSNWKKSDARIKQTRN